MNATRQRFGGFARKTWIDAGVVSQAIHPLWARNYDFAPNGTTTLTVVAPDLRGFINSTGIVARIWNTGSNDLDLVDSNDADIETIGPGDVGVLIRVSDDETGEIYRCYVKAASPRTAL